MKKKETFYYLEPRDEGRNIPPSLCIDWRIFPADKLDEVSTRLWSFEYINSSGDNVLRTVFMASPQKDHVRDPEKFSYVRIDESAYLVYDKTVGE